MQDLQTSDDIYEALRGHTGSFVFRHKGHPVYVAAQADSHIGPMRLVFMGIPAMNALLKYCPRELLLRDNRIIRAAVFGGGFPFALEPYRLQDWTGSHEAHHCHFLVVAFHEERGARSIADGIVTARARVDSLSRDDVEQAVYDVMFDFLNTVRRSKAFRHEDHTAKAVIEMLITWRERSVRFEAKFERLKSKKDQD